MKKHALLLLALILCALALPALADAPEIRFSVPSGFYSQPQSLEIVCDDPDAVIYYTMDGKVPDAGAVRYTEPIVLDSTLNKEAVLTRIGGVSASGDYMHQQAFPIGHTIRAVAISLSGETSTVASGTWFIGYDRSALYADTPVMLLVTDPAGLFDYEEGIYVLGKVYDQWAAEQTEPFKPRQAQANYTQRGSKWERPVSVTFLPASGDGFVQDMGVRIKGDASRLYNQKSLRLIAREQYGLKNVKYEIFPDNEREEDGGIVSKYKSFTLRNGGNDCDYAKIRDPYVTRLAEGLAFETAQSMPCIAFINGEYWGLYTLVEEFSDNYFQYHYGLDNENVVIVKCGEVEDGTDEDILLYEEMTSFIATQDMADPAAYEKAGKMLDLDSFAELCAIHLYIGNNDGVFQCNNWQMWRVREPEPKTHPYADGKWRMILYDSDISAGVFSGGEGADTDDIASALAGSYGRKHPARLFVSLLKNKDFRDRVILALCDVRNIFFAPRRTQDMMALMSAEYLPYATDTLNRFGPEWAQWGNGGYYADQLKRLSAYYTKRWDVFMQMVQGGFELSDPCAVIINVSDDSKGEVCLNGRSIPVGAGETCLYFPEYTLTAEAVPAEGCRFTGWTVTDGSVTLTEVDALTAELSFQQGFTLTANFE